MCSHAATGPVGQTGIGVVTELNHNECTFRLRNRSLKTTLAVLTPIALPLDSGKELRLMGEITHYISFELKSEDARERIAELQVQLQQITGMGKPTKIPNLHLTLSVLSVSPSELKEVCAKTSRAVERFRDLLSGNEGFTLTASMAQFLDHGSLALGIDIARSCVGWPDISLKKSEVRTLRITISLHI